VTSHALTLPDVRAAAASLPRVNLLPPEVGEERRLRRTQRTVAVAGLAVVAGVGLVYAEARDGVAHAQSQLASSQAHANELQSQLARFVPVDRVYAQVAAMQADYQTAMAPDIDWATYLNNLSLTIPSGVWLDSITANETAAASSTTGAASSVVPTGIGTITFTGTAFRHDDVADWLVANGRIRGFTFPYLSTSAEQSLSASVPEVTFTSSVVLTKSALSGRAGLPGS
jgi:Tfp pilus assembly protein PilN